MYRMLLLTTGLCACTPPNGNAPSSPTASSASATSAPSVAVADPPIVDAGVEVAPDDARFFGDADAGPRDFALRFERTACFGTCPMYTVHVGAHGDVRFSSRLMVVDHFVDGCAKSNVGDAGVAEIRRVLARFGYFSLKNAYEGGPTDSSWVNTTVSENGQSKTIRHYMAAPINAGELARLEAIEEALDRLTGAAALAKKGGTLAACVYTGR